ncbi:MAG TPA: glycosyltransferase, partial [Terriglobales bacterium]|nr:glycosyltransferase [Terriglobales bacterium]
MVTLTIAGAVAALIWAYLLLGRGGFWRIGKMIAPVAAPEPGCRVAVIIPARNEAAVIVRSIASLLESAGESLHIFLVDDSSSDGTAQIARQAAASMGKLASLTVLQGQPLPPGWSG